MKVTNHRGSPKRVENLDASGHRVPQMRDIGLRAIHVVCEQADNKADVVPCDRLPLKKSDSPVIPLAWLLLVVVLDQATKALIIDRFAMFELLPVIPGLFNLTYLTNTGAAFGMLAGAQNIWRQVFFVGVAVAALGALIFSYQQFRKQGRIFAHAIGLIAGGAVGNLLDRLRFGAVVDFLDFYLGRHHWPAFNVADSAICVGVGLFILGSILYPPQESEQ